MSSRYITLAAALCLTAGTSVRAGVYSMGHGDLRIRFQGGQLLQSIHLDPESIMDGTEAGNAPHGVDYVPDDTTILVPEPTLPRPEGAEWDFIATAAGNPVWFIPEVQEFDRPWLGYSTESLNRNEWTNFRLSLLGMTAPFGGQFSLTDSGGPFFAQTFLATGDGITLADSFNAPLQTHAHYSWLFTRPGDYYLTLQISGTHQTAGPLSSTAVYHFAVVPEPSGFLLLLAAAAGSLRWRQRRSVCSRPG
jgi:surface-anchored protein